MFKIIISMFLVLCMAINMIPIQAFSVEPETTLQELPEIINPFKDVSKSDWYYDSVMYAYKNGLLMGTSENTFSPNGTMTRAMFVTILGRIAKVDLSAYSNESAFIDVVSGSYYEPYVQWATKNGITSGIGNGKFNPNGIVTREQMATFLVRFFDAYQITYPEAIVSVLPKDINSISSWAKDAVLKLWTCGLFVGDNNGNFNPRNNAKRSEAAALCQRINILVEKWLVETGVKSDSEIEENLTKPKDNNSSSGGGSKGTTYYKVNFKAPEGLTGATMPEEKFDGITSSVMLETPNYMTVVDVDTNFTFQVKASSVEDVKSSLTIKNITANNQDINYTVSGGSSPFTVTGSYVPGQTYKAQLTEDSDTAFVYNGIQPESIRVLNFITNMDEVLNLSLSNEIKYISKNEVSNITGNAFDGLFNLNLKNGTFSADDSDGGGTFTYNGGGIAVGDTVSIYSGTRPDKRDLTSTGNVGDGDVAYVKITDINGNIYSYTPAD